MIDGIFTALLWIAAVYSGCGIFVTAVFLARWMKYLDPSTAEGSRGFRVLVVPGLIALWPVVLVEVFAKNRGNPVDGSEALRRNHRAAFVLLAIFGGLLFIAALAWREPGLDALPETEIPTAP